MRRTILPVVVVVLVLAGCDGGAGESLTSAFAVRTGSERTRWHSCDHLVGLAQPYRFLYSSDMAKTVPFTEARAKLSELLDELDERHEHVVITRSGRPVAVLVPADEQEILEETLEILQDESLLGALRESEQDVKAGRVKTLDEVRRDLGLA
jgi:prevent-host-death family protein